MGSGVYEYWVKFVRIWGQMYTSTDEGSDVAVQVDPMKPTLKMPGATRLKLTYDYPLSNFDFNFTLRRYIKDAPPSDSRIGARRGGVSLHLTRQEGH